MKNFKDNIVLVGMPGCGKSTIGQCLSKKLNMKFCDLDEFIEARENMTIAQIFKFGEKYFRDAEQEAVNEISTEKGYVISTGGGVILRKINIDLLKKNGCIIFINRPIENIISDVDVSNRPLLRDGIEKIYKLYNERYDFYKKYCDLEIMNTGTVEQAVYKIVKADNIADNKVHIT